MLIANEIIQTVHEHSKMTTLHEGGGGGGVFHVQFWKLFQHFWPGL